MTVARATGHIAGRDLLSLLALRLRARAGHVPFWCEVFNGFGTVGWGLMHLIEEQAGHVPEAQRAMARMFNADNAMDVLALAMIGAGTGQIVAAWVLNRKFRWFHAVMGMLPWTLLLLCNFQIGLLRPTTTFYAQGLFASLLCSFKHSAYAVVRLEK